MITNTTEQSRMRRQRGVVLTPAGLKRLRLAIQELQIAENNDAHFTREELGERINVSTKTLTRLWSLNSSVDHRTLTLCFNAFNLKLRKEDYTTLSQQDETEATEPSTLTSKEEPYDLPQSYPEELVTRKQQQADVPRLPYPDGPVPLDSPFYIERSPIEALAYQEITQAGCVIRIRAPKAMGKSSLVLRLLTFAEAQGYRTASLDCNQLESSCLTDVDKFLRCFCLRVAKELGVEPKLDNYWDFEVGSKLSCSLYFKTYLLKQIDRPVVLVLNEVDRLFEYPQLAAEFFPLLRSWYEEARQNVNLQKLRLVVVYSTEEYVALDINRSPFNIGLPLRLSEFTQSQVHDLASRHGLDWSSAKVAQLMVLTGGHPYLTRIALYHICTQGISLEQLLQEALDRGGIFHDHLWRQWLTLQKNPGLVEAIEAVVTAGSISLNPMQAYKLESQGLICIEGDRVKPRCELYRAYFKQQLSAARIKSLHYSYHLL